MRRAPTNPAAGNARTAAPSTSAPQVDDATAQWLRTHRDACNARLEAQRQRSPRAPADRILSGVASILPIWHKALRALPGGDASAQAASAGAAHDALLFAILDLVILHAARDTLARPGVHHLLHDLPRAADALAACLAAPRTLPASLSNAAERMGTQGPAFVEAMLGLAPARAADAPRDPGADVAAAWLRLGAIVAWRLGDPRFRAAALAEIAIAPARPLLCALGLAEWPESLAEVVRAGLLRDAWWDPKSLERAEKVGADPSLARTPWALAQRDDVARIELQAQVGRRRSSAPLDHWIEVAQLGDYVGLGGAFQQPPQVVAVASAHVLFAAVGSDTFRIDADRFGVRVAPVALADVPGLGDDVAEVEPDPSLRRAVERLHAAQVAAGATSLVAGPGAVAWTHKTSFRIRLLLPPLATVDLARS